MIWPHDCIATFHDFIGDRNWLACHTVCDNGMKSTLHDSWLSCLTYIQALDGSSIAVWLYNGNIRYLSGKHIPLFMFILLVLLFLFVPYTAILLFAPWFQWYSRKRMFAWIESQRLKPLIHSYYTPLKDKYHPWIGLLLVLRLCILLVFMSNSLGDPSIIVLAITSAVSYLCSVLESILWNYLHQLVPWCTWTTPCCKTLFIFPLHFKNKCQP